ncbi:MAG: molybdopterin-dependent oxidoreductase, partial [Dongiaceae bacterium]
IDSRGREVMRILPRLNVAINEEWLADKSRYACDGLKRQRLDRCYIRVEGKLQPAAWEEAFAFIAKRLKKVPGQKIAALAGDLCDTESMLLLKELMQSLGSNNYDCRQDGAKLDASTRAGYLFNTTIAGIEQADACLLIGANPRVEAPLVMARLRKRFLQNGLKIGLLGASANLTAKYEDLGDKPETLVAIAHGKHPFHQILKGAKKPMLIIGMDALTRNDGAYLLHLARHIADSCNLIQHDWNGFNVLHTAAARVGGLDVGFVPPKGGKDVAGIMSACESGEIEALYLLGADEIDTEKLGKAFVIYQGHHGDKGAHRADVILPGAAYTEKDGLYVNMEGRAQYGFAAVLPPGEAKEDWKILRALSERLGHTLPYNTQNQIREKLASINACFAQIEEVVEAPWGPFGQVGTLDNRPFEKFIENYYMTDAISRASPTMAKCTAEFLYGTTAEAA